MLEAAIHDEGGSARGRSRSAVRGGRTVALLFVTLYLPLVLGAGLLLYAVLEVAVERQRFELAARESSQVAVASQILVQDFADFSSDLMVLARAPLLRRYLDDGAEAERALLVEAFLGLAQEKQSYDQIRLLGADGMELIRVNFAEGRAWEVPRAELQPKGGRYFFKDTIRLARGEIYVSPLDLNIEHGAIEQPHKPMLRYGAPVFDSAGRKRGAVVINVFGRKLIEDFRHAMGSDPHAMLINRDGDWLSSADPAQDWGFMFGRPHAFARRHPEPWRTMAARANGSFEGPDGLYTFATVRPLAESQRSSSGSPLAAGSSPEQLGRDDCFWKVVSLVPAGELPTAASVASSRLIAAALAGLLVLAALVAMLALAIASRRQARRKLIEGETQLREITSTLGEGVYVVDAAGRIDFVNPEAERLLGWTRAELLGCNAHTRFHLCEEAGLAGEEAQCGILGVIRSGCAYRNEDEVFRRKDGSLMSVAVSSTPIVRRGAVVGAVVAFQDITERKRDQEKIRKLAFFDPLTDLPNRRLLMDRLEHALAQARRHRRALALMFIDLDRFKDINDGYGHEVGDAFLKQVAGRLAASVRDGDTVARLGGDEFVILLSEIAHSGDAVQVAEKLLAALGLPYQVGAQQLRSGGSIGIALYRRDAGEGAKELMQQADVAMYAAKQAGRNCYRLYGEARRGARPAP